MGRSRCRTSLILNLGIRRTSVVSFTARSLYPGGNWPAGTNWISLNMRRCGPQSGTTLWKRDKSLASVGIRIYSRWYIYCRTLNVQHNKIKVNNKKKLTSSLFKTHQELRIFKLCTLCYEVGIRKEPHIGRLHDDLLLIKVKKWRLHLLMAIRTRCVFILSPNNHINCSSNIRRKRVYT